MNGHRDMLDISKHTINLSNFEVVLFYYWEVNNIRESEAEMKQKKDCDDVRESGFSQRAA